MRTFAIGDIHGGYKALVDCLKAVNFDYEKDKLIALGDVCDGWSEVFEAIDELRKIKNLVYIKGNHDDWTIRIMSEKLEGRRSMDMHEKGAWLHHGGKATSDAMEKMSEEQMIDYHIWLSNAKDFYIDEKNRLFVHAGYNTDMIDPNCTIEESLEGQDSDLYWDRTFWRNTFNGHKVSKDFEEVYIGHTPTINYKSVLPINRFNVWNLDTGACFFGRMTIMNIDTKEYYQTKPVMTFYPYEFGRNSFCFARITDGQKEALREVGINDI